MKLVRELGKKKCIDTPFFTSDGFLTTYAFEQGYVERYRTREKTAKGVPVCEATIKMRDGAYVVACTARFSIVNATNQESFGTAKDARECVKDFAEMLKRMD